MFLLHLNNSPQAGNTQIKSTKGKEILTFANLWMIGLSWLLDQLQIKQTADSVQYHNTVHLNYKNKKMILNFRLTYSR